MKTLHAGVWEHSAQQASGVAAESRWMSPPLKSVAGASVQLAAAGSSATSAAPLGVGVVGGLKVGKAAETCRCAGEVGAPCARPSDTAEPKRCSNTTTSAESSASPAAGASVLLR